MSRTVVLSSSLALLASPVVAHELAQGVLPKADPWSRWSFEPAVVVPLALVGGWWLLGWLRLKRRSNRADRTRTLRNLAFAVGWLATALALCSPLHAAGSISFFAHMTEHEILMLVAAPLLALSRPSGLLLWGLPRACRRGIGRTSRNGIIRGTWRFATDPIAATVIHGGLVWVWHLPVLFDAAVRDEGMHTLQHLCFFGSAVLFWWAMFFGRAQHRGFGLAAPLALFATATHSALLGALLVVAPRVLYVVYDIHGSALEDQQLAGLIMWVPTGIVYTLAGLALMALWLGASAARSREFGHAGLVGG